MNIYDVSITTANKSVIRVEAASEEDAKEVVDGQLYDETSYGDSKFEEWSIDEVVEIEKDI